MPTKTKIHPYFQTISEGLLTNIASGDLGNADTSYTYVDWATRGVRMGVLQMNITATTITLEASNDLSDVTNANATWTDITQTYFGVVNRTATGDFIIDTPLFFSRVRVKRVTT